MSPAGIGLAVLGLLWIGGGSLWLLTHRSYRLTRIPEFLVDLAGFPVEYAQRLWGRQGVPFMLLMPNMIIFGLFTFVPLILNFYVSMTSGESILLHNRPFVGWENYARIFECETIFSPRTCSVEGYAFWNGMFNTILFVLIQVPVLLVVSLMTAIVVNRAMAGRGFWRAMFFYPVMLSPVVIANIWGWVLDRRGVLNHSLDMATGTINALSATTYFNLTVTVILAVILLVTAARTLPANRDPSLAWACVFAFFFFLVVLWSDVAVFVLPDVQYATAFLGLALVLVLLWLASRADPRTRIAVWVCCLVSVALLLTIQFDSVFDFGRFRSINWLVTPNTGWPFFWLVFVYTWSHAGFFMLILLAGLQAIPADLYEAARMDGTRPFRVFTRITVPLVMPTILVVLVLSLIRSFQIFDESYLLTGGGPGRETQMIVQNIYETAFGTEQPDYGIASASSVLMAAAIAIFALGQLVLTRRQSEM
ncbi:carbohydrate ABC transporter permease [Bauldia sp.]|uniref:carbohydrate ABC transporter permease n=1 Tax=Bauldia sp. TaxID=2575872 RepID=UPI003BA913DD